MQTLEGRPVQFFLLHGTLTSSHGAQGVIVRASAISVVIPFRKFLGDQKRKCKNNAYPEGSTVESYLVFILVFKWMQVSRLHCRIESPTMWIHVQGDTLVHVQGVHLLAQQKRRPNPCLQPLLDFYIYPFLMMENLEWNGIAGSLFLTVKGVYLVAILIRPSTAPSNNCCSLISTKRSTYSLVTFNNL